MSSGGWDVFVAAFAAGALACLALVDHIGAADAFLAGNAVFCALLAIDIATNNGDGR